MPKYHVAAKRHFDDADLLRSEGRLPNADQLAGLAAECALKEMLVSFFGAHVPNETARPVVAGEQLGHLPKLWTQAAVVIAGRAASSALAGILHGSNPFATWSIHDRYGDGSALTQPDVDQRIEAARLVLGHLQAAKATGSLP